MRAQHRYYSSLGLLLLLNAVIKPVWLFGVDRQVQNLAGAEAYGHYFALFNLSIVANFMLDMGLTTYTNRMVAVSPGQASLVSGKIFTVKLVLLLLYAGTIFLVALFTGFHQWSLLMAVVMVQALNSLLLFLRSLVTAHQWLHTDAWLSVLDKSLMLMLCGSFLLFPATFGLLRINTFIWSQVICTAIAVAITAVILLRRSDSFQYFKPVFPGREIFRQAFPYALIVALMSAHYRMDGFLLERIHPNGAHEAGIYASAYRLLDAANMAGFLLASFLLPFTARHYADNKLISSVVTNSRHVLVLFAIWLAASAWFYPDWLQHILYHRSDPYASKVLQWCLTALVGYSLFQVYGTVLTATGQIGLFTRIVFLVLLLNLSLNAWLIPRGGALGAAGTAIISQLTGGLLAMFAARKKCSISLHGRSALMYIFITGALLLLYALASVRGAPPAWTIGAGGILILGGALATGLLKAREWREWITNGKH